VSKLALALTVLLLAAAPAAAAPPWTAPQDASTVAQFVFAVDCERRQSHHPEVLRVATRG